MHRTLLVAALSALALMPVLALLSPALAQATVIDGGSIFGAWKPYITEIVSLVAMALVGWLAALAKRVLGITIEARHRDALQTALVNAAGLALSRVDGAAAGIRVDVKNEALADAVRYVLTGAPDAIAYFGLTPERLRQMVEAKLGVVQPAPAA